MNLTSNNFLQDLTILVTGDFAVTVPMRIQFLTKKIDGHEQVGSSTFSGARGGIWPQSSKIVII